MQAISFQAVVDSKYPAVIRAAAAKLMTHEYMNVGDFLAQLPQPDVDDLVARGGRIIAGTDSDQDFDSMVVLGCMLCQAEGGTLEGAVDKRTSNLIILLGFEDLARKGIIDFHREKATLANDDLDMNVAKLK